MRSHPAQPHADASRLLRSARRNKHNAEQLMDGLDKAYVEREWAWQEFYAALDGPEQEYRARLAVWEQWDNEVRRLEGKQVMLLDNAQWIRSYDELKEIYGR